jgi:dsRNA-specific ribonuclease
MTQKPKKTYTDINVFYPDDEEYVENVDFNSSVLESVFTSELSKIYVNYIFSQLQKGDKVFAWNINFTDIPLLIEIISRPDTAFIFIFASNDKCISIVSSVLTLLKLGHKCNITQNSDINIDIDNLIYIGIDKNPLEETKNKIAAIIIILVDENNLKIKENKKLELSEEKLKSISIFIQKNKKEIDYPTKKQYNEYESLAESSFKRPQKKNIKDFLDKEKKSLKTKPKFYTETLNNNNNNNNNNNDDKNDNDDLIMKGDKHQDVHRVDLSKAHKDHPDIGGWIQIDNGVQNFYLFGVTDLKSPSPKLDKSSKKYETELANYIISLIELFNPYTNVETHKFVDKEYMPLWIKTWTHESFDIMENYETLETLGDSYFASAFVSFLFEKFPEIDQAEMTNLKANIGSKGLLRQVGWGLKMDEWLRMGSYALSNTHTAEDIVEAFCGTLQIIGNNILFKNKSDELIIGPNKGITFVRGFIDFLFSTVEITDTMFEGPSKTRLQQSVQGFFPKDEKLIIEEYENGSENKTHLHKIKLSWSDKALDFLKQNGFNLKKYISYAEGHSQKGITDQVYTLGILNLEKQGYTIKDLEKFKYDYQMSQLNQKSLKDVIAKAKKQLNDPKVKIEFYAPKTLNTKNSSIIILLAVQNVIGVHKKKKTELATIRDTKNDSNTAKNSLLEIYLKK